VQPITGDIAMNTKRVAIYALLPFLGACGTMIKPGEMAMKNIIFDEPALREEILPEGFYWQWPWNSMISYDVTLLSRDEDIGVLTKDSLHVPTTATVTFRPRASQLYQLHTEIGPTYYEDVIGPAFVTLVRTEFSKYNHNDLAKKSGDIEAAVLIQLRNKLKGLPLEIDQISIKHIRYEQLVTRSISKKLVKEQEIQQKQYEIEIAKKDADIARTTAAGIGDAIRITAEGQAKAIVIKARAQAEAQQAINKTLSKRYLQYKAFDSDATRYYFVPTGKDAMPIILNTD
jgi:regulator of protease activity HflC (stomatin/prohibitin superfamily)